MDKIITALKAERMSRSVYIVCVVLYGIIMKFISPDAEKLLNTAVTTGREQSFVFVGIMGIISMAGAVYFFNRRIKDAGLNATVVNGATIGYAVYAIVYQVYGCYLYGQVRNINDLIAVVDSIMIPTFIPFIFIIGALCLKGTDGENQYGPKSAGLKDLV